jgi:hypothetical protein
MRTVWLVGVLPVSHALVAAAATVEGLDGEPSGFVRDRSRSTHPGRGTWT